MVLGQLGMYRQKMTLDSHFTLYSKINSKWITDLKVKANTVKLSEENIRISLFGLGLGSDSLDVTPQVQATTTKNR